LDVVEQGSRIWLVMEHVHGETLARLLERAGERGIATPPRVARAIACGVLRGLHAAHEATDTSGKPLHIIHRDVSPHNVIVSAHGVARVLDFGIAKAAGRLSVTRHGQLKGKLAYMAPEQFGIDPVDRRVDIFAAAVLISELFAGRRLREPKDMADALARTASADASVDGPIRDILARGLAKAPNDRYPTAGDMAEAIEATGELASDREVTEWLRSLAGPELDARRAQWERDGGEAVVREDAPASSDATVSAVAIAPLAAPPPPAPPVQDEVPTRVEPARAPSRRGVVIAIVVAVSLIAATVLLFRDPSPPQVSSSASAIATATPPPSPPPSASSAPIASPPPPVTLSAEPKPTESAVASSPVRPPMPTAKGKKPAPDCDPPYKLDERGVKVLKLECLR
ncbi:MAG: serine/threonine protein kinase, partial [Myxococcales bacterium]|nr:serine/threonine protein kinase [Myxococcales bacterium]